MKKFITFNEPIKNIVRDVNVTTVVVTKVPIKPFDLECVTQIFALDNPDIYARFDFNYKEQSGIISLLNPPPVELQGLVHGETLQANSNELIVRAESDTTIYYCVSTEYQIFHALEDYKKEV